MDTTKFPAKVDVPVLIIFFCRSEQLGKVFDAVRNARPSKLYLYQDGPRVARESDGIGIQACRQIVDDSQIDWECEVHRLYQNSNFGCDPSEYLAQKWLFAHEDMGIILEDDDVPSQSFFRYCKELLEHYRDDPRINMICGMNNTGVSKHVPYSYLFTQKGSIWGWASWKRVIDTWDGAYTWLDDPEKVNVIKSRLNKKSFKCFIDRATEHRNTGREHYESINAAAMFLNGSINIVPKYNMISNIGVAAESTHSTDDIRLLPKRTQKLLFMKTYEIDFPLSHPEEIQRDLRFEKEMTANDFQKACDRVEHLFRVVRYKGLGHAVRLIKKRLFHEE